MCFYMGKPLFSRKNKGFPKPFPNKTEFTKECIVLRLVFYFSKYTSNGFSWKRALGIIKMKRKISRKTGIPLTRSGRQRKFGKFFGIK